MKKAIEFFVKYPIWGNVLIVVVIGLGILSMKSMHVSFFPETEERNISIQVAFPGASPQEMEEGVVLKIEESLKGTQGIEQITSVSSENMATLKVEGKKGFDPEQVLSDVKNAVDRINSFPENAEKPVVFREKRIEGVATLLLMGDVDLYVLKKEADKIEDELLASGKVSQVTIKGIPDREISIEISEDNLKRYGLRFEDLSNAVRKNNIDVSAGSLKTKEEEILIRSRNKKYDAASIGNIIVRSNATGSVIRIRDIAEVKEQFADVPEKSIYNGRRAVTIQVNKTREEDLIGMADDVENFIKEYNSRTEVFELKNSRDSSTIVRQRIDLLVRNAWVGLILVLITLGFFLNIRLSGWVAFAIPLSFLGMFVIANLAGITINVISLFGMILVVGILVDDGIVIGENIYSHFERGKTPLNAAVDGTSEVITSVFSSVSTTIVMFIPFFFLDGTMGEFFPDMAIVVISCLAISLLEGAFVLPAHLAHSKALHTKKKNRFRQGLDKGIDYLRYNLYGRFLDRILNYRYSVLALSFAFILIVKGMMSGEIIKTTFFPNIDSDNISIDLTMKPGTREEETEKILKDIEEKVWEVNRELSKERPDSLPLILSTRLDISKSSEKGLLEVDLLDGETRDMESFRISEAIRKKVGVVEQADKLTFGSRFIFGKPVSLSLVGKDLEMLDAAKEKMKQELNSFPTLKDVNDNNQAGKREITMELKPLASFLGLTSSDIARQIRQGFFGEEAQRLQVGNDEVRVWVRYPESERKSIGKLEEVKIKVGENTYPLTDLIDYSIQRGIVTINHLNGARQIKVEADLTDANEPVPPLISKIKEVIVPGLEAEFPGVRVHFEGQDKESQKFQKSAKRVFPIALAMMLIILVLTFRSWSQMFLIVLMIPLGIFGALAGHGIVGRPISVFSFYGIIALTGIVVNDAVVFLDKFNSNLRKGMKIRDAVHNAGVSRFRAILLTSLTTVAGLYPLILEKSRQAQFLVPMAVSVAWGLIFVTFFILFTFPNLILVFNDIRRGLKWLWTGEKPTREEVEPALAEIVEIKKELENPVLENNGNVNTSENEGRQSHDQ